MENLLKLLKLIEADPSIRDDGDGVIPSSFPLVKKAQILADELLISPDAVKFLNTHGYPVCPAKKDSVGWLSGGIGTERGTIAYG